MVPRLHLNQPQLPFARTLLALIGLCQPRDAVSGCTFGTWPRYHALPIGAVPQKDFGLEGVGAPMEAVVGPSLVAEALGVTETGNKSPI